ncbi:hypothetical protein JS578_02875 [Dysgonomonadaceae bacterium zrk40]|nr:hypothetical protein JS578_02875 [Dysgonomonadaceae bacterium zrk40]
MKHYILSLQNLLLLMLIVGVAPSCSEKIELGSFTPETPVYSFAVDEINIPKEGGDFSVEVKSNLPWRAKTNATWISLTEESGLTDGTVTFTASRNRTIDQREGEIIVWVTGDDQKSIRIVQAPSEPSDLITHYYAKEAGSDSNDGLSWETAVSLAGALDKVVSGDVIHIAAGTHLPKNMVTGGNEQGDITFEIHSNVTLIGGYADDATEGAQPDPLNNETILSGNREVFHTMTITAPVEEGKKVMLNNLTITQGHAGQSNAGTLSIGGLTYRRSYGGGISVGGSKVEINNCVITDNESRQHAAGIYMFNGAELMMRDCDITNNKGILEASNGGGIFNESATLYLMNCNVTGNSVWGVGGGLYSYSANTLTYLYLYNSTVAFNSTNAGPNTGRRGGGLYAREFSRVQVVNSTFYSNESGRGGGISIYGAAGKTSSVDLINSTVFNNYAINNAAGVEVLANTTFKAYNSIIAGNSATTTPDLQMAPNTTTLSYMVTGNQLLDAAGAVMTGVTFDAATMLGTLMVNGGRTQTSMLSSSSPAAIHGMTTTQLEELAAEYNPPIDTEIILKDQTGASRNSQKAMGAVVPR